MWIALSRGDRHRYSDHIVARWVSVYWIRLGTMTTPSPFAAIDEAAHDGHLKFFVPHRYRLTNSGIGSPSGRIGIGRPERSGTVTFLASIPRCR